jgi:hypothetical protein
MSVVGSRCKGALLTLPLYAGRCCRPDGGGFQESWHQLHSTGLTCNETAFPRSSRLGVSSWLRASDDLCITSLSRKSASLAGSKPKRQVMVGGQVRGPPDRTRARRTGVLGGSPPG